MFKVNLGYQVRSCLSKLNKIKDTLCGVSCPLLPLGQLGKLSLVKEMVSQSSCMTGGGRTTGQGLNPTLLSGSLPQPPLL